MINISHLIKNFSLALLVAAFSLTYASCGSSGTATSSGGSDSGGTDSGGTDSGGTDSGGTDSGGSGSSTSFEISGTLSAASLPSLSKDSSAEGVVTDVIAVSPQTAGTECVNIVIDTDGSFTIPVTGGSPWSIFFYNRYRTGSSMFEGWFRSDTMDTLTPQDETGSMDLGTVSIDQETEIASSSRDHSSIVSDLGLDADIATELGDTDDISLRYSNPDIDGDGEIDCTSSTNNFLLDFHVRFLMRVNGELATVDDIIDNYLDSTAATASYDSTGIFVQYPSSFSSVSTGSVKFVNSSVTTYESGLIPANTETSDVVTNTFGTINGFGPNIVNTSSLPTGTIIYSFGGKTLTFTNVQTPSLAHLASPTGRILPFVKYSKADPNCTSNCGLSGVSYKWMRKTASGWTAASLTELALIVKGNSSVTFRINDDETKTVSFLIPKTSLEGTISWNYANTSGSLATEEEFNSVVTTQICHIGLAYDDKLGMRYFESIADAEGTCD